MHLIAPVCTVIDTNSLDCAVQDQQQHDGVVRDLPAIRRKPDSEPSSERIVENLSVARSAHRKISGGATRLSP